MRSIYALLTISLFLGATSAGAIGDNGGDDDQDKEDPRVHCASSARIESLASSPTNNPRATCNAAPPCSFVRGDNQRAQTDPQCLSEAPCRGRSSGVATRATLGFDSEVASANYDFRTDSRHIATPKAIEFATPARGIESNLLKSPIQFFEHPDPCKTSRGSDVPRLWNENADEGTPISKDAAGRFRCTPPTSLTDLDYDNPAIIPSSTGYGAIVAYAHERGSKYELHAQRLSLQGNVKWPVANNDASTDIAVAPGPSTFQCEPVMIPDGSGGAILAWEDLRNGDLDIYAQRIDLNGNVVAGGAWQASGRPVASVAGMQSNPAIASDDNSGAFIAWQDSRSGTDHIYVQHLDASGAASCDPNGEPVLSTGTSPRQRAVSIAADGSGGAFLAWEESGADKDIFGMHIDANCQQSWLSTGPGLPISEATGNEWSPTIISDEAGGAIVTWSNDYSGVHAAHIVGIGTRDWSKTLNGPGNVHDLRAIPDGNGGAVLAWTQVHAYTQHIDSDGTALFGNPVVIAQGDYPTRIFRDLDLATDGNGGALVTMSQFSKVVSSSFDVVANHVTSTGALPWGATPIEVGNADSYQELPHVSYVTDRGTDGPAWMVVWFDGRDEAADVYGQCISPDSTLGNCWPNAPDL